MATSRYGSPRAKELGKATVIQKSNSRWIRQADAKSLKRRLLEDKKHQLINKRNALILQESILEARMLRLSKTKQKKAIEHAVGRYLTNTIRERKKMKLPTRALEERLANRHKIVDRMMGLPASKKARRVQKGALALVPGAAAGGLAVSTQMEPGFLRGVVSGLGGAGAMTAYLDYKDYRGNVKDLKERLRKERRKIEDQLN